MTADRPVPTSGGAPTGNPAQLDGPLDDREAAMSAIEDFFARLHNNDEAQGKAVAEKMTEAEEG